jgi:hypothetical protein
MLRTVGTWVVIIAASCGRGDDRASTRSSASTSPTPSAAPPNGTTSPSAAFSEAFDDAHAVSAWTETDGAVEGPGPASAVAFEGGAVRLEGDDGTRRWRSLERGLSLAGTPWLRVSARMKTDGVAPSGAHRAQCYVYVRFADAAGNKVGDVVATRTILGTTPWTPVARRFAVPSGAANAMVGLFLSSPGRAWFDDVRAGPIAPPEWHDETAGHYHYHWLADDRVDARARDFNAESYGLVAAFLELDPPSARSVEFYKYPDTTLKEELMGEPGNAYTMPDGTMHSIFATDRHEIVHVLAKPWGDPPALVAEGLAVHLSGGWQGKAVEEYAKGLVDSDWIALEDLLDSAAFRSRPDRTTYAIAGAFVGWVLSLPEGKSKLRSLYGKLGNRSPVADNDRSAEGILGMPLREADLKLRAWLRSSGN